MLEKQDLVMIREVVREELQGVHGEINGLRGEIVKLREDVMSVLGDNIMPQFELIHCELASMKRTARVVW